MVHERKELRDCSKARGARPTEEAASASAYGLARSKLNATHSDHFTTARATLLVPHGKLVSRAEAVRNGRLKHLPIRCCDLQLVTGVHALRNHHVDEVWVGCGR